jgi:hypothetical protein
LALFESVPGLQKCDCLVIARCVRPSDEASFRLSPIH